MLRRSVMGLRILKQWKSQSRRKLYHFGELSLNSSISLPNPPLIHPHNSIAGAVHQPPRPMASSLESLERVLRSSGPRVTKRTSLGQLPQALRHKMKKCSDPHVRLDLMLDFKEPLRVSLANIDNVLEKDFGVGSAVEALEVLDDRTMVKLVKYYIVHRDYNRASVLVHSVLLNRFQDVSLIHKLNAAIFDSLKKDYDLSLGFMDLCRSLYKTCEGDMKLFKFCFTSLTNNGAVLRDLHFKHPMFLDVLRYIQLATVIEHCDDVTVLPQQYWITGYDYVDLALVKKLLEQGSNTEALEHMNGTGLIKEDGLFNRVIASISSPIDETISLQILKNTTNFGMLDKDTWRRMKSKPKFFKTCFETTSSPKLKHELQSIYLSKLMKLGKLLSAKQHVRRYIQDVAHWGVSPLISLVLVTKDQVLCGEMLRNMTPSTRNIFLDLGLKRIYSDMKRCKEVVSPESQLPQVEWLLKCCNYKLSDATFETLCSFLSTLPLEAQASLLQRISGPSASAYLSFIKRCKSVLVVKSLIQQRRFRTRAEKSALCKVIDLHLSFTDIKYLFGELDSTDYNSLHPKYVHCLLKKDHLPKAQEFLESYPNETSKLMLNNHLAISEPMQLTRSTECQSSNEKLQVETYNRLLDNSRLYMDRTLRFGLKQLKRNHKMDQKTLCILVLKQCVERTKLCNRGSIVMNERLKWALSQCDRYNVPSGVIEGIMS